MLVLRRLPGILYAHRYTGLSLALLATTILYLLLRWGIFCTDLEAWHHVQKACRQYGNGNAIGTLCIPLCVTKDIHSLTCHSFHAGKEAVFSAEWRKSRLVFKAAASDVPTLHWFDNGIKKYPTEHEFQSTIRAIVRNKLNMTLSHDSVIRLSRLRPNHQETDIAKRQSELDNLWPLLQDNEYLISALFVDRDIFPQILGTCGQYFAVEFLDPIQATTTMLTMSDSRSEWGRRLKLAVMIMEVLDELETGFREPFHLCDIKLDHFGLAKGGNRLKFIDLESVYPRSVTNRIMRDYGKCNRDSDCEFLDCRARCDGPSSKCTDVTNNNLQIVCEKIFLGWRLSNTVLVPGLLMSQHTPAELASVLRQCANPEGEAGNPRGGTSDDIRRKLYNIIVEMEQNVNNDFFL